MARQKGIPIITGIEMFVQQGARQFEIFTGKPAPEEEMLRVVIHSLRQQAEAAAETPAPDAAKEPASNGKKASASKAKKAS
jgi:3-dehydroquinate dehydratase/shikimate dehydrogenase